MKRVLVIGNSYYNNYTSLTSVEKDVESINETFKNTDAVITKSYNESHADLINTVDNFINSVCEEDIAIIYYTGHGMHSGGRNYIVCADSQSFFSTDNGEFLEETRHFFDINHIISHKFKTPKVVLFFDACRLNESTNWESDGVWTNQIVQIYSTNIGMKAYGNSAFCNSFCKNVLRFDQSVGELFEIIFNDMKNVHIKENPFPVLIRGQEDFCIETELNAYTEEQYFSEKCKIIKYYHECNGGNPVSLSQIEQWHDEKLIDYVYPYRKIKTILDNRVDSYDNLGILSYLIKDKHVNSIHFNSDRFRIRGKNGSYSILNDEYYDYDKLVSYIESIGRKETSYVYWLYDYYMYINLGECENPPGFEIRIENCKLESISYFVKGQDKNFETEIEKIINARENFLISADIETDISMFMSSLLSFKIPSNEKKMIFYFKHGFQAVQESVTRAAMDRMIRDGGYRKNVLDQIKFNEIKWLIIPLDIYFDATFNENDYLVLTNIVDEEIKNEVTLIFYTEVKNDYLDLVNITKKFSKYCNHKIIISTDTMEEVNMCKKRPIIESII